MDAPRQGGDAPGRRARCPTPGAAWREADTSEARKGEVGGGQGANDNEEKAGHGGPEVPSERYKRSCYVPAFTRKESEWTKSDQEARL